MSTSAMNDAGQAFGKKLTKFCRQQHATAERRLKSAPELWMGFPPTSFHYPTNRLSDLRLLSNRARISQTDNRHHVEQHNGTVNAK
jgi:hypothetical protein